MLPATNALRDLLDPLPHSMGTKENNMFDTYFIQSCKTNNIEHTNIRPATTDKSIAQTAIRSAKQLLIRCKLEEKDFQTVLENMRKEPVDRSSWKPDKKKSHPKKRNHNRRPRRNNPRRAGSRGRSTHQTPANRKMEQRGGSRRAEK